MDLHRDVKEDRGDAKNICKNDVSFEQYIIIN